MGNVSARSKPTGFSLEVQHVPEQPGIGIFDPVVLVIRWERLHVPTLSLDRPQSISPHEVLGSRHAPLEHEADPLPAMPRPLLRSRKTCVTDRSRTQVDRQCANVLGVKRHAFVAIIAACCSQPRKSGTTAN